jgi:hypothetical protein
MSRSRDEHRINPQILFDALQAEKRRMKTQPKPTDPLQSVKDYVEDLDNTAAAATTPPANEEEHEHGQDENR